MQRRPMFQCAVQASRYLAIIMAIFTSACVTTSEPAKLDQSALQKFQLSDFAKIEADFDEEMNAAKSLDELNSQSGFELSLFRSAARKNFKNFVDSLVLYHKKSNECRSKQFTAKPKIEAFLKNSQIEVTSKLLREIESYLLSKNLVLVEQCSTNAGAMLAYRFSRFKVYVDRYYFELQKATESFNNDKTNTSILTYRNNLANYMDFLSTLDAHEFLDLALKDIYAADADNSFTNQKLKDFLDQEVLVEGPFSGQSISL